MLKKSLLIVALLCCICSSYAQMRRQTGPFSIYFGVNLLDNNGDHNPFSLITEPEVIAFSSPLEIMFGYRLNEKFEAIAGFSFNKFNEGQNIDGGGIEEDLNYSAVDLSVRAYPATFEFSRYSHLRLYTSLGLGVYKITSTQVTGNLGLGAMFNVTQDIALYVGSTAKFSLDNKRFSSNLFHHSIGIRLNVFNNCNCSIFR